MRRRITTSHKRKQAGAVPLPPVVVTQPTINPVTHPKDTVSVVIPCKPGHIGNLPAVIQAYMCGTVAPLEIIIGMCLAAEVKDQIRELRAMDKVLVVETSQNTKILAGDNRNAVLPAVSGDIVLYQDADDLPSPQRVEIIKHIFHIYSVVHVSHGFVLRNEEFPVYDLNAIKIALQSEHSDWFTDDRYGVIGDDWTSRHIGMGVPAVLREVAMAIPWNCDEGFEDQHYNRDIASTYGKSCVIDAMIYKYFK